MFALGMVPFDGHMQAGSAFHWQIKYSVSSSREITDVNGNLQQTKTIVIQKNLKPNLKTFPLQKTTKKPQIKTEISSHGILVLCETVYKYAKNISVEEKAYQKYLVQN